MIVPSAWPQVWDFFGIPPIIQRSQARSCAAAGRRPSARPLSASDSPGSVFGARRPTRRRAYESSIVQSIGLDESATKWQRDVDMSTQCGYHLLAEDR